MDETGPKLQCQEDRKQSAAVGVGAIASIKNDRDILSAELSTNLKELI